MRYYEGFLHPATYSYNQNNYKDYQKYNEVVTAMFKDATEEYQKVVKEAVISYMQEVLSKVNLSEVTMSILHEVMVKGTWKAVQSAISNDVTRLWTDIASVANNLNNIQSRLGISPDISY